jgi:Spy/CpxP family protein refolding chaperone
MEDFMKFDNNEHGRQFGRRPHFRRGFKALGILLAIGGIGVMAAGCHRSPEEKMTAISEKIADKLDFNDQQKALLADIIGEMKKDFAEEKALRQSMKGDFKTMILSDDLDKSKIKSLIKERQARMDSKVDKYLDKVAALHKTLTPEQKKEIIDKIEKVHRHWE